MTEVLLYHHVQGLTEGVRLFADELRQAGHTVHTPDLFDGRTFDTIEEGIAFARETGFGALSERGVTAAEEIGPDAVYAGFSFGVMVAQQLAQTRPGARGSLLMYSCLPVSEFGDAWPEGVPVQVHGKQDDPFFAEDLEVPFERPHLLEAGQRLAEALSAYGNRGDVVVLALPRGGVPVAFEVAKALSDDTYCARKRELLEKYDLKPETWTPADSILSWWYLARFFAPDGLRDLFAYYQEKEREEGRAGRSGSAPQEEAMVVDDAAALDTAVDVLDP